MKKRITAIVIAAAMLMALAPACVMAEEIPKASVEIKGKNTYTTNGSFIIGGGFTSEQVEMPLQAIMEFTAIEEENETYGNWYTDFYITLDNLEGGSFTADENCYIAGNYEPFEWIKIPLNGIKLDEGTYPVMATAGALLKYSEVCSNVKVFTCGIHLSDEVLEANPDIMVTLELGLSENAVDIDNPVYTTVLNTDGKKASYRFDKASLQGDGLPFVEELKTEVPVVDGTKPVKKIEVGTSAESAGFLQKETESIVDAIKKGETVKGITPELANKIAANEVNKVTTEVKVDLVDEKDLEATDISKVKAAADEKTIAQYLDLSVIMTAEDMKGNKIYSEITELSKPITFTIAIPEELKTVKDGFVRKFYVIRVHEGKTEILPVTTNDDGTLSFTTDKFSTYALAYADTPAKPDASPNTGDNSMVPLAMAGMAIAAIAAVVASRRRTN